MYQNGVSSTTLRAAACPFTRAFSSSSNRPAFDRAIKAKGYSGMIACTSPSSEPSLNARSSGIVPPSSAISSVSGSCSINNDATSLEAWEELVGRVSMYDSSSSNLKGMSRFESYWTYVFLYKSFVSFLTKTLAYVSPAVSLTIQSGVSSIFQDVIPLIPRRYRSS